MPSRTSSPVDVLIDYAGAILGILICRLIHLVLTRRSGEKAGASGDGIAAGTLTKPQSPFTISFPFWRSAPPRACSSVG